MFLGINMFLALLTTHFNPRYARAKNIFMPANVNSIVILDPVYTLPDPHGHDIKLNSFTTSVALTRTIVLQHLTTSSHRKKW